MLLGLLSLLGNIDRSPLDIFPPACFSQQGVEGTPTKTILAVDLTGVDGGQQQAALIWHKDPITPPKVSPKHKWEFPWLIAGYAHNPATGSEFCRFRVYSQMRDPENDKAAYISRMAARMWEINMIKLRVDHNPSINSRIVDFYICNEGTPGGEQLFSDDKGVKVNTIYIYQMHTFTDPVEMAREVAHEYGHASLVSIGGYEKPEAWASGHLGEHMYMRWLRDRVVAGKLEPKDVMGATGPQLDAWVKKNVDPLVIEAAVRAPEKVHFEGKDEVSMNSFVGLALYADSILPESVFRRTFFLIGSIKAVDYPNAIVSAMRERPMSTLTFPSYLRGKAVWVPCGATGRVTGGKILERNGDWAKVQPEGDSVTVIPDKAK